MIVNDIGWDTATLSQLEWRVNGSQPNCYIDHVKSSFENYSASELIPSTFAEKKLSRERRLDAEKKMIQHFFNIYEPQSFRFM